MAGVCAAAARATGTDPVLWRVVLAVLTVFGGTGLLVYLAGWLLIPEKGAAESIGERTLRTRGTNLSTPVVVVVAVAALVLVGSVGQGLGLAPLLVVAVVAYLVWRSRADRPSARPATPSPGDPSTWTVPPTPGSWAAQPSTVHEDPIAQHGRPSRRLAPGSDPIV